MNHYNSNHHGRRGRDSRPKKMYNAVCSSCGNDCQVPFNPTGDRPVYCSDCFEANGGKSRQSSDRSPGRRSRSSSYSGPNQQSIENLTRKVDQINAKLDSIIDALNSYEEEFDRDDDQYETKVSEETDIIESENNQPTDETEPELESEPKTN